MTLVEIIAYAVIILVPIGTIGMAFVVALGKRPGYRRRNRDSTYNGVERRCPNRPKCGKTECTFPTSQCPLKQPVIANVQVQRLDLK